VYATLVAATRAREYFLPNTDILFKPKNNTLTSSACYLFKNWFRELVQRTGSENWFRELVKRTGSENWFRELVKRTGSENWFRELV
jgi:hypothetical protein